MKERGDSETDLADKTFDERQVVLALVTPVHPASVEVGPVRLAHCVVEVSRLVFDGSVVMCLKSGYVMNGNGWIGEQV
jgi:hypothetical protein